VTIGNEHSPAPLDATTNNEIDERRKDEEPAHRSLEEILKSAAQYPPRIGEIVEGPLIARGSAAAFVDLGVRGTGIIYGREFFLARDALREKSIGDIISAKVIDPENDEGYVELSMNAAGKELAWKHLKQLADAKETIEVVIEAANRGGLIATVESIKAFLPVSHLAPEHYPHVEGGDREKILEALRKFVGTTMRVKIINLDPASEKLIISERAVIDEELREELKNFHVGDTIDGTIAGIVDFGLFIRFGPDERLEGLAHISELSWENIDNIRSRYRIGEHVKAKIIDIEGDRVSLSLKALLPHPESTKETQASKPSEHPESPKTPEPLEGEGKDFPSSTSEEPSSPPPAEEPLMDSNEES
jgi:small subunit ribosomal protein S1